MELKINDGLYALCARTDIYIPEIEEYIEMHKISPDEISYTATMLVERYQFEIQDFIWEHERKPLSHELVCSNWIELFDLFISKGLNPNLVISDREGSWYNIMDALFSVRNGEISLPILKKLLEIGGNPNLMIYDETLFDRVDFEIVFGAVEQEDREFYDIWVKFWFLLMGYGGRLSNGHDALKLKNGNSYEIFKNYERLSFNLEFTNEDWYMHIFLKDSGEEIAFL